MSKVLLFGGTGFLGKCLASRFRPETTRIMARNEKGLVEMKSKGYDIEVGDIADIYSVKKAMWGVDDVYVLSAIKGVDIAEKFPIETSLTNIMGLINVIKTAQEYKTKSILFVSTDKASQVNGVYGASKFIGEAIMRESAKFLTKTKLLTIRYGNVWGSTGSVIVKWKELAQKGERLKVTNPEMTRFFWTVDDAVDAILEREEQPSGSLIIPKMKAARMGDIAEAFKRKYLVEYDIVGERGGENLHETLDGKTYSNEVERYTIAELEKMI